MSERAARTVTTRKRLKTELVVVDFDAEKLKAPFLIRCGALLIDYILLISPPVISLIINRWYGEDGAKLLSNSISNAGWLIMILIAVTNLLIFPLISGQSLGKMLTGLRIVNKNGYSPTVWALALRHSVGYLLTAATFGLGFLISMVNAKGRALHDFLAGTVVVYGKKRIAKEIVK